MVIVCGNGCERFPYSQRLECTGYGHLSRHDFPSRHPIGWPCCSSGLGPLLVPSLPLAFRSRPPNHAPMSRWCSRAVPVRIPVSARPDRHSSTNCARLSLASPSTYTRSTTRPATSGPPGSQASPTPAHTSLSMAANCPNTKMVLGGYSPGRGSNRLRYLRPGARRRRSRDRAQAVFDVADHVAAVVLFGYAQRSRHERARPASVRHRPDLSGQDHQGYAPEDPVCSDGMNSAAQRHLPRQREQRGNRDGFRCQSPGRDSRCQFPAGPTTVVRVRVRRPDPAPELRRKPPY